MHFLKRMSCTGCISLIFSVGVSLCVHEELEAAVLGQSEEAGVIVEDDSRMPQMSELHAAELELAIQQERLKRKLRATRERLARERDKNIRRIQRETDFEIQRAQNRIRFLAVVIPPTPPILLGVFVYVRRRIRERDGIAPTRLR